MFHHTKTLGMIQMDESVWKKLPREEKQEIEQICDEKLQWRILLNESRDIKKTQNRTGTVARCTRWQLRTGAHNCVRLS